LSNQFVERDVGKDNSRNNSALKGSYDSVKRLEAVEKPEQAEGLIEYPIPPEKSRSSKKKSENNDS